MLSAPGLKLNAFMMPLEKCGLIVLHHMEYLAIQLLIGTAPMMKETLQ
jgi:hypothetical protein